MKLHFQSQQDITKKYTQGLQSQNGVQALFFVVHSSCFERHLWQEVNSTEECASLSPFHIRRTQIILCHLHSLPIVYSQTLSLTHPLSLSHLSHTLTPKHTHSLTHAHTHIHSHTHSQWHTSPQRLAHTHAHICQHIHTPMHTPQCIPTGLVRGHTRLRLPKHAISSLLIGS